jgi:hypothetical protein
MSELKKTDLSHWFPHLSACYKDDVLKPLSVNEESVLFEPGILDYCCSTTWSPSFRPFTISVCDPFDSPTATATLRVPSF